MDAAGKYFKGQDYSSDIDVELRSLIAVAELLEHQETPAGYGDNYNLGLSFLLRGVAGRINAMLNPTEVGQE